MLDELAVNPHSVGEVVEILRLLADPTRLRVLSLLRRGEMNVSSLCSRLGLAQPTVSHHLGLLRSGGLLDSRRSGKQVFYSLSDRTISRLNNNGGLAVSAGPIELRLLTVDGEKDESPVAAPVAPA